MLRLIFKWPHQSLRCLNFNKIISNNLGIRVASKYAKIINAKTKEIDFDTAVAADKARTKACLELGIIPPVCSNPQCHPIIREGKKK